MRRHRSVVILLVVLCQAGCGDGDPAATGTRDGEHAAGGAGAHGHHHVAPHGGALVALGDHFAHLELVFDAGEDRLTLYVLDGAARDGVRVTLPELRLRIRTEREELPLVLEPVERALTGETRGDSSEFSAVVPALRGAAHFEATVAAIRLKGQDYTEVVIPYPAGDH